MPSVDPVLMIQSRLTDRDWTLLGWLADHGVLTSDQIAHALFPSLDACQRRLQTLHRAGVLGRFRPQRWEGGSYPYHYVLEHRLLPLPLRPGTPRRRTRRGTAGRGHASADRRPATTSAPDH